MFKLKQILSSHSKRSNSKMLSMPLLSIVVVTHNRADLLKRTLSSILVCNQDRYEIILCADDSNPETIEVAKQFLRSEDSFIRIPNMKGPAQSRNMGAKLARGQWISFIDDDDTFGEEHISKLLDVLPNERNKVLYFNFKTIVEKRSTLPITLLDSSTHDISKRNLSDLLVTNFIPMHAMVFSAELLSNHSFDARLQSHEDWDLIISLLVSGAEFEWMDCGKNSVTVHLDESGTSRNKKAVTALDYLSIYRKWPAADDSIKKLRSKKLKELGIYKFGTKIDYNVL